MSRTLKNIIMIIMLVITLLLTAVTVYKATDERIVLSDGIGGAGDPNGMGGAGDPSGLASSMGGTLNEDGSITMKDGSIFYPDGTAVGPDGNPLSQEQMNQIIPGATGGGMMAPEGGMGVPDNGQPPIAEAEVNQLDKKYYVYFGVENLISMLILGYLILSGFNKKEINETFDEKIKFVLLVIILVFGTGIFTYACNFVSNTLAEKLADIAEEESKSNQMTNPAGGNTTTPDANQNQQATDQNNTTGTETTDPNAGGNPQEGGGNFDPNAGGNPQEGGGNFDPNAGGNPQEGGGNFDPNAGGNNAQ